MLQWAEKSLKFVREIRSVIRGYRTFLKSGTTPSWAYQSLVSLHCATRGRSSDVFYSFLKPSLPRYAFPEETGILGEWNSETLARFTRTLKERGFYVFPRKLDAASCDELYQLAHHLPCDVFPRSSQKVARYDPIAPISERYNVCESEMVKKRAVQQLMCDYSILSAAQAYLDCAPVLDSVLLLWTVPFLKTPSDEAAQLYHFDMDRLKWIKFFVYLTDVTTDTGPHCYVAKSHRPNGQKNDLLKRGYARLSDNDIAEHYPSKDVVEITGKRGTILSVDTRGFHKGKLPTIGHRLALELEFSISMFGAKYDRIPLETPCITKLREAHDRFPRVFYRYRFSDSLGEPRYIRNTAMG